MAAPAANAHPGLQVIDTDHGSVHNEFLDLCQDPADLPWSQAYSFAYWGRLVELQVSVCKYKQLAKYALIGAVVGNHMAIVDAFIDKVDYYWLRRGLIDATVMGRSVEMIAAFADRVGQSTLNMALLVALEYHRYDIVRLLLDNGASNYTEALHRCSSYYTPSWVYKHLIEQGAIHWAYPVYIVLQTEEPDYIVHLHKLGIPHCLLINGRPRIQSIIDKHLAWNAHVHSELASVGVYSVLANLITQY